MLSAAKKMIDAPHEGTLNEHLSQTGSLGNAFHGWNLPNKGRNREECFRLK